MKERVYNLFYFFFTIGEGKAGSSVLGERKKKHNERERKRKKTYPDYFLFRKTAKQKE